MVEKTLQRFMLAPFWLRVLVLVNACAIVVVLTVGTLVEQSLVWLPAALGLAGFFWLCLGPWGALFATFLSALTLYAISITKYAVSGFGLVASDSHLVRWNIVDLFLIDWRVQVLVVFILLAAILEFLFLRRIARFSKRNLIQGSLLLAVSLIAVPSARSEILVASTAAAKPEWVVGLVPSLSTLVASFSLPTLQMRTDPHAGWIEKLAPDTGYKSAALQGNRRINLIIILYESTFDPAYIPGDVYPSGPSELLQPSSGVSGPLLVPAYGGGTWLSEFALLTGQSPHAFGANAYVLNSLLAGRINGNLLSGLIDAGFNFNVVYPFPRYFINAGAFYEGLGAEFIEPSERQLFEFRKAFQDELLFARALDTLDPSRSNVAVLATMLNHTPHDLDAPFEDYWSRQKEQDENLRRLKFELSEHFSESETYVLAFGDHHPVFTSKDIANEITRHTTFWSLDCVANCANFDPSKFDRAPLGIEFLLTMVLRNLDLPRAAISVIQEELLQRGCRSLTYMCQREDANAFNWYFANFVIE